MDDTPDLRAVRGHDMDLPSVAGDTGKVRVPGDQGAVGRSSWIEITSCVVGESDRIDAVGVHNPDFEITVGVGAVGESGAIWRPGRIDLTA